MSEKFAVVIRTPNFTDEITNVFYVDSYKEAVEYREEFLEEETFEPGREIAIYELVEVRKVPEQESIDLCKEYQVRPGIDFPGTL